jgi:hypothetical protein
MASKMSTVGLHGAAMEVGRSLDHAGGGRISHSNASSHQQLNFELASGPLHAELTHLETE